MKLYSNHDYPSSKVPYPHVVTCPGCGFGETESHMYVIEWFACCIRDYWRWGYIWSPETDVSYGMAGEVVK